MIRDLSKRRPVTGVPWERQPGESALAYRYFCYYRDLGKTRTAKQVAKENNRQHISMESHCMQWKWVERCAAWDDHCEKRKQEAYLKEIDEMAKRHARLSVGFQSVLSKPVEAYLNRLKKDQTGALKDFGGEDKVPIHKLFDIVVKSAQVLSEIINIERKSKGEPSEIMKQDLTSGGKPIRVILPMQPNTPEDDD